MLAGLGAALFGGRSFDMPGMVNAAATFGVLWVAQKWTELAELGFPRPVCVTKVFCFAVVDLFVWLFLSYGGSHFGWLVRA